jgi:hypothetical protein
VAEKRNNALKNRLGPKSRTWGDDGRPRLVERFDGLNSASTRACPRSSPRRKELHARHRGDQRPGWAISPKTPIYNIDEERGNALKTGF